MLLLLGGGGYWTYSYFTDTTKENEVVPAQQELLAKEADSAEAGAPAAEPPVSEEPVPTVEETPSLVEETTTTADVYESDTITAVDVDYAPASLAGMRLLCSYQEAEISSRSEASGDDFSPYSQIIDNGKGAFSTEAGDIPMLRSLTVFTARTSNSAPLLLKYTRTGKNTAEVIIHALMIPDTTVALAISNVVSSVDYLTEKQIAEKIGQYFLDSSDTLKLTFTGENTAIAEGEYSSGTVENKMRGIIVRLEPGNADAVEPEANYADTGASTYMDSRADSESSDVQSYAEDRSSLDPLIARMRALRCRHATSALYQRRLLTLLPMIRNGADVDITLPETKGNMHVALAA